MTHEQSNANNLPPWHRGGRGLVALAASGLFTSASFFASFLAIALVVRDISLVDRAGFFLFLAIYAPIVTVLSQRILLSVYQARETRKTVQFVELSVIAVLTVFVVWLVVSEYFSWIETIALAGVIFSQTFAATRAGSIQHHSGNALGWAVAVFSMAIARIALTWALLPFGPIVAFAAGSYGYLGAMQLLTIAYSGSLKADRAGSGDPATPDSWRERLAEFAFFVSGAMFFQADKYLLNATGRLEDLSQSGALTTLLLSPLSVLFATLYRSRSRQVFSSQLSWPERLLHLPAIVFLFLAGGAAFLSLLLLFWPGLSQILFPFLSLPPSAYLALAVAIAVDRLITLLAFTGMDWRVYLTAALLRLSVFALILFGADSWFGASSLSELYMIYSGGAIAALLIVFSVLYWIQRSHVRR